MAHIAEGDYDALIRERYAPVGTDLGTWVRQYPAHVVALPPAGWKIAACGRVTGQPGTWWIVLPLYRGRGSQRLSLEATIRDQDGGIAVQITGIHVL